MAPVQKLLRTGIRRRAPHRVIIARGEHIRTFTVRPWLIWIAVVVIVGVSAGYLGATGYLVFRDDLLAASIARQASMQHTYEDRISALRADIDRLTSRQLLNQHEVEAKVDELTERQSALSERQNEISGLAAAARAAGIATVAPQPAAPAPAPLPPATPKSTLKTGALLLPSVIGTAEAKTGDIAGWQPPLARIADVEVSLNQLASSQASFVDQLAVSVLKRNDQIAAILKTIGRSVPTAQPQTTDVGGPFVPPPPSADPAQFDASIALVKGEIARYAAIRLAVASLPLRAPVPDPQITSGFGTRLDPFLGTPALHTGIDFRASEGQPIGATAPGTVIAAETGYNGGYGNMVDIDHGNGVVTRFGHLSTVDVQVGQAVAKGTIIGRAGSTGRATGPHLHYEIRIDDTAIDPAPYFTAGDKLLPLL